MKKILISGYYGFDNAGDEAVLQAIIDALKEEAPFVKPIVLSANPEKTAKLYKVEAVNRFKYGQIIKAIRNSDGLISGGGSLLQDETGKFTIPYYMGIIRVAQFFGKPTFIYAQGVGPVNRKHFYSFIKNGFNKAKYISVRDKASASLLEKMKVPLSRINIITDPVLGLRPLNQDKVKKILANENIVQTPILISVRFWKENKSYLDIVAEVADELVKMGEQVVFVPMHEPSDRETSEYVLNRMKENATILNPYDIRTLMGIVKEGKCLVGMRLHSLIFASAMAVPTIGISYDPKIDSFLAQINQTPVGTTEDLEFSTLFDQIKHVLSRLEDNKIELEQAIVPLKEKARRPAKEISHYFQNDRK